MEQESESGTDALIGYHVMTKVGRRHSDGVWVYDNLGAQFALLDEAVYQDTWMPSTFERAIPGERNV